MRNKIITFLILAFTALSGATNAQTTKYEDQESAVGTLSSYYNAVNNKDYRRAYGYWRAPDESFENFIKGFDGTSRIQLIIEPPVLTEGAAGSLYTQVPTVLIADRANGRRQTLAGCYTMWRSNLRSADNPEKNGWQIYRASIKPAPADQEIPQMLAESCEKETAPPPAEEQKGSRVLGVLGFDSSDMNDAIKAPATVRANEDFQITVTTSGNGCVSAGDAGVVLAETGADVFIYDFTAADRPGIACTMLLKRLEHTATLRFSERGEAVIRVWGRKQSGGSSPFGEPVVIERRITVK